MAANGADVSTGSQPIAGVGPRRSQPTYTVPDDWEADTNEEDKDNKDIWEEASVHPSAPVVVLSFNVLCSNSKAPMPQIVIAASASPAPPPTAFAPSMRILKRPQSASPKPATAAAPQKSLAEREAEYKAARDRIFAANPGTAPSSSSTAGTSGSSSTGTRATSAGADKAPSAKNKLDKPDKQPDTVVRQPRGPSSNSGRGFGNRRTQGGSRGGTPGGSGAQSPSSQAATPRTQTPAPSGHLEKRS
ncbi:hypothetical protein CALVIDRAFT_543398 [Calocera viscosa TUFC12733]|uniref:SUZ RNA-binding domain-containing n=1 Tax=Calocera viscosa (strain TUFC12733) TaxID=1330018 RepID=A0A167FM19_CALVF|nr:hypothetical protein CALVIDRAFT_543398 [Calocera viscosa TUFC12733]